MSCSFAVSSRQHRDTGEGSVTGSASDGQQEKTSDSADKTLQLRAVSEKALVSHSH